MPAQSFSSVRISGSAPVVADIISPDLPRVVSAHSELANLAIDNLGHRLIFLKSNLLICAETILFARVHRQDRHVISAPTTFSFTSAQCFVLLVMFSWCMHECIRRENITHCDKYWLPLESSLDLSHYK